MVPIHPETRVLLGPEPATPQRYSIWSRVASWPLSQKGLCVALTIQSICTVASTIGLFFTPDPPQDHLLSNFVDSSIVSKNCQQWNLFVASLATTFATGLVAAHFLQQKPPTTTENAITPEMGSAIRSRVDQEIQKIINSRER